MPCATPSADHVGTAAYAEPGDGMWLPQNSDGPAPVTFLDDTVVGTRFKARGGAVVDASLEQIKLGLRGQADNTRPRRPMSVVSDSAYGGAHTGWDWGVPAQELAADGAKEEQPAADEAREGQPVATSTACSLDMSRMLASLGNPGAQPLAISLCGIQALQSAGDAAAQAQVFADSQVDVAAFKRDAMAIVTDPHAVFRTSDGQYAQSEPLVVSLVARLAFGESLGGFGLAEASGAGAQGIVTMAEAAKDKGGGSQETADEKDGSSSQQPADAKAPKPEGGRRWWPWGQRSPPTPVAHAQTMPAPDRIEEGAPARTGEGAPAPADAISIKIPPRRDNYQQQRRRGGGTLRLTSAQLKSLGLQRGANTVKFLVPSNKAYCEAKIFFYGSDTHIVISDIDGTITKDWTHAGVAKLYTDIACNGYEILYLTSRAIGQAAGTRLFLDSVKQGQYALPMGPLLLSPDRLFTSFHREVIMRRPHRNLFGGVAPFYAGFGNRITDAMSYRSVNVPVSRICTIDTAGEVKLELLPGYRSSYVKMNDLVDMMFPPLAAKLDPKFNDWEFWKTSSAIEAQLEAEQEEARQAEERDRQRRAAQDDGRKSPSIFTRATRSTRAASSVQPSDAALLLPPPPNPATADARPRADSWAPLPPAPSPPVRADSPDHLPPPAASETAAVEPPIGVLPAVSPDATQQRVPSVASSTGRMSMLQKVNPFNLVLRHRSSRLPTTPGVAAAASRLVPQFSAVSIESKNPTDDEDEYSDADDVDSEIDDDDDDDDDDDGDEIDQETMNIIHDLDEIQYL
ncbi:LNS2-domain-containing protein [Linderina pennispora]|uniref:LNS2-domain-containing protein n=1 Tax=Linderina pennispora TaxID=61395 RepID=A0A1Y1WBC4_9FUNG|nr:LNS2-domain-containing protein [Linderina pennispora]ORX70665.1 LNS2-domain-containing protein [Linderina pennispora]